MGRKLLCFCPMDWLDVSHGAYITARPAGREHCLCLSVCLTRTHAFLLAADKVPECLPACVPHPGAVSLSDSSLSAFSLRPSPDPPSPPCTCLLSAWKAALCLLPTSLCSWSGTELICSPDLQSSVLRAHIMRVCVC